jgi:hypothetical protein
MSNIINQAKGGTRKISTPEEDAKRLCMHPEHNPAMLRVYEPGTYEHICPACGAKMVFTVPRITC